MGPSLDDEAVTTLPVSERKAALLARFERDFVPLAYAGLARMLIEGGSMFCNRAVEADPGLDLEGRSPRYAAMSLIGLAAHGGEATFDLSPIRDALVAWTEGRGSHGNRGGSPEAAVTAEDATLAANGAPAEPGDAGLILWLLALERDERAARLAESIVARREEILDPGYVFPSMEMGWLLTGIAEALGHGVSVEGLSELGAAVAERLRTSQRAESDLFQFRAYVPRKNFVQVRRETRLGSFASQVYPTIGLARWSQYGTVGCDEARDAAERCARRIAELQGPEGQWWWIYQVRRPEAAIRYPVYTVHQDAMGPMMLLAAGAALDEPLRYLAAIEKSVAWFDDRSECVEEPMIDVERAVVWRAVQRDPFEVTADFGLGAAELRRKTRAAFLGSSDERSFDEGYRCRECRPYHLGWILLAAAWLRDA